VKIPLTAEPEAVEFDPRASAVMVIDMQNYDCTPGGFFDLVGTDFSHGRNVVEPIKRVLDHARSAGVPVVYTEMVLPADRRLWPTPESPWYRKANPKQWAGDPELERGLGIEGTWAAQTVDELKPTEADYVIKKQVYSGFVNTDLDIILRRLGVRYLFFTGIGTPTCVEATARDAYFRDYWPILLSDCCGAILPETHEQALFAIKRRYGWVTSADSFLGALALAQEES
jgi:ureidoacrylate peracid hydrolase